MQNNDKACAKCIGKVGLDGRFVSVNELFNFLLKQVAEVSENGVEIPGGT